MNRYELPKPFAIIGHRIVQGVLIAAVIAALSALPTFAAGAIVDRQSCMAELASAEEAIVRANIESAAFRALNDKLAEMKTLCDGEDYAGAQTKLRDVMNALGGSGSSS